MLTIRMVHPVAVAAVFVGLAGVPASAVSQSASASLRECSVGSSAAVAPGGVGPIRIGMSFDEIQSLCRVTKDTLAVNPDYVEIERVLEVNVGAATILVAGSANPMASTPEAQTAREIYVLSPALTTGDGLRVGSTWLELFDRSVVSVAVSEAYVHATLESLCGVSFILSEAGSLEHGDAVELPQLNLIPLSAVVERIHVTECLQG